MQPELQSVNIPYQSGSITAGQNRVLRNTYLLLALSMVPTVIGAALGTNLDLSFMRTSPILSFFAILGIFFGWMHVIEKNRNSVMGVWLLLGFTMFLGALLGPLLQRVLGLPNGVSLVMMAAGGTAVIFALMAGIATTTKRDLSTGLGGFLAVGSIVLILAVIANAFVQSPVMYMVLLAGFVLISTLMMLWQINTIVRGGETNYVSATLTLYISIYNLFSSLLQLLGIGGSD